MHLGMSGRFRSTTAAGIREAGRVPPRTRRGEHPRPRGVPPLQRRHGHLQRCAPVRLHGPRAARRDSKPAAISMGWASSRSATHCRARPSRGFSPASARRSRPPCSTSALSPGSATSTYARRCSAPASIRKRRPARSRPRPAEPTGKAHRLAGIIRDVLSEAVEAGGSTLRDHAQVDGPSAISSTASGSTTARASPA